MAKGFTQVEGFDFNKVFSPIARMESIEVVFVVAVVEDFQVHQMDVIITFLNEHLLKEIYMQQPKGFVVKGKENMVCKFQKSLYGLE